MSAADRILIDPRILAGKPIVRGTRLSVDFLLELLAQGWTKEQLLQNYPQLTSEDIQAVLQYAADVLKEARVYPLPS